MDKRLVLLLFVGLIFLSAGFVSAGSWYDYDYGYRSQDCDHGYRYGYSYSPCYYKTETFRDTTENKHTNVLTSQDRYVNERIKTVTTSYTDIERETKIPVYYSYGQPYRDRDYRVFYPGRTNMGSFGYEPGYRYSDYRYSYNVPGYVSSPDYYYVRW
ncbi:MAG: hypothetical protein AABX79_00520 [Nanoarchaeota archaeon]